MNAAKTIAAAAPLAAIDSEHIWSLRSLRL